MIHPPIAQGLARAALAAACALLVPNALAAEFGGIEVPPPLPARPVTESHWGVSVEDPYRFLENVADTEVQKWLRAQADATGAILDRIAGRDALLARMREIEAAAGGVVTQVRRTESGRWFFLKRDPGDNQFRLVWRDRPDGPERLIVDPEPLSKAAGRPHAIMDYSPSRDGSRVAYSMQAGGSEIGTLHVVEVSTGRELIAPIDRIRYAEVRWLDGGRGFFYSRLREGFDKLAPTERFHDRRRHYRAIDAAGTDRVVFSPVRNAELKLPGYASGLVFQVPGTRVAGLFIEHGVDRNVSLYLADIASAIAGTAQWRPVFTTKDQISNFAIAQGWIYLRSSQGAPRYKLLRVALRDPQLSKAQTVIPPGEGVLVDLAGAQDALYVTRREGVTLSLLRVPHATDIGVETVALPFAGRVSTSADPRLPGATLDLGGWTRAAKPFLYDPATRQVRQLELAKPGIYDAPPNLMAREVTLRSHDGTSVPLSIVSRADVKLDGGNPTILYGYGAYGSTDDPFFTPRIYAWLERGGVYAIAHVRGGGAFGEEWHLAGRKQTKPNTWKDAIASAEWLVAQGYTSRERIGIYGGSAGGIFVGRAITERPDLFAAAVPVVGVMDMLRFEVSANGVANVPEFGTVKKEDEFRALLAMSSYQHLKPGVRYPGTLLIHGVNDIRVDVWQSAKFASRLASVTTGARPVLMRLDYESGHGQGSTRAQLLARIADSYAFMLWQFGVPEFQPRP